MEDLILFSMCEEGNRNEIMATWLFHDGLPTIEFLRGCSHFLHDFVYTPAQDKFWSQTVNIPSSLLSEV